MKSFISKVVEEVLAKHKNYSHLTFVVPSQRACVFLRKELIPKIPSATFLPNIESIENYIQQLADIQLIDNIQLLFEFYSIYKKTIPKKHQEPFNSFAKWAVVALKDFNEVDSNLVDTISFFSNLKDIKKLEKWFDNKTPSDLAKNYLQFFESLHTLYTDLYEKLRSNQVGYQGLIYREATENLTFYMQHNPEKHIVFVGFNALNKAEEYIFQELLHNNMATVYWDADDQLLNTNNEAGLFLRTYKNDWDYYKKNPFLWSNNEVNQEQNIQIIGAPKNVTQVKYVGELLSTFENFDKTAFVLADENLLPLALNSLPKNVKNVNITMGYPLGDMPIANLFHQIFRLYLNQQKFQKTEANTFYYKDVLNILNNSFLRKVFNEPLQQIADNIKKENSIFVSQAELKKVLSKEEANQLTLFFELFEFSNKTNLILKKCSDLILQIKNFTEGLEREYLYRFYNIFQQLTALNTRYDFITDLNTLSDLFNQLIKNEKLSFQGEPLQGLQLMGMLETRTLDFETLIITSVNEGILPGGKSDYSFVPFDVKKHFDLPTYLEKDAIFSYHFQRLIKRAKHIYLIYNTEMDGYGSGEKSRFLTQLAIKNPAVSEKIVSPYIENKTFPTNEIKKPKQVIDKLKEQFKKGISPSALVTYLYDPITFYEQRVLGIKEDNLVEETIAANTMGNVIHLVLEELYLPFVGKFVDVSGVEKMLKQANGLIQKCFKKQYLKGNIETGKNRLIVEVCKEYIRKFLHQEKMLLSNGGKLKIIALEKKLETEIEIQGIEFPVKLIGYADRIDELNGVTRIIDYKTGKVEGKDLKMDDFSNLLGDYKNHKILQVMMYSYMLTSTTKETIKALETGIISFKNLRAGFIKMNFMTKMKRGFDNDVTQERIAEFMLQIEALIKEILNPEIPFKQNEDLAYEN